MKTKDEIIAEYLTHLVHVADERISEYIESIRHIKTRYHDEFKMSLCYGIKMSAVTHLDKDGSWYLDTLCVYNGNCSDHTIECQSCDTEEETYYAIFDMLDRLSKEKGGNHEEKGAAKPDQGHQG